MLTEKAREGSTSAMIALERALRVEQKIATLSMTSESPPGQVKPYDASQELRRGRGLGTRVAAFRASRPGQGRDGK